MTAAPLISLTLEEKILQRKADGFLCELDVGRFVRMPLVEDEHGKQFHCFTRRGVQSPRAARLSSSYA